ncbi:uncharacterized protein LAESUDRAFT_709013 [Laetiporus sulphureus 93-53]|uniref:NEDD8-activating enzyme E1 regulatory subunit n=1 Tax=Laetiporus sulphureus 93-53 TaxID=1314785 RepID=A0A165B6A6_9APHY|nr:uncharacterized protein LAESUDRAFT_709013 [Laetiporus sulphureus 93-53]KZT00338.1 hypothetical protein LAESUDRAFT_709013 [Laetiporus sulphureus 93-53]
MSTSESRDIEAATTAIQAPDAKTRRYDRQLRLWAASGQSALESARILVLSSSATATAVLKNLVLPGIGHFVILDDATTSPADAGNNFFLAGPASIGKPRAQEAVPLLRELNDSVQGEAVLKNVKDLIATEDGQEFVRGFSLVIAHNLQEDVLDELARLLWADIANPPLIVVRSAGFLAEFFVQFHEHCVSEPHTDETPPSLRIIRPFPALLEWARSLDLDNMDPTDHAHVPFVIILVRAVDDWRKAHDGKLPATSTEKQEFKASVRAMRRKADEENFDEAEAQAWRVWMEPAIPTDIKRLLALSPLSSSSNSAETPSNAITPQTPNAPFHALLRTLGAFVADPSGPGTLPLSGALPDMRTDTESYVRLQRGYREWAGVEKARFKELLKEKFPEIEPLVDDEAVDTFVKNAHQVRVLRGKRWGAWGEDKEDVASSLQVYPRETATHLALSALAILLNDKPDASTVTTEALNKEVRKLVGENVEFPEDLDAAIGEIARAPTADLPNTAAFLGGLVAQEAIKMITKQYVPVNGSCVLDLVDSWTGVVGQ